MKQIQVDTTGLSAMLGALLERLRHSADVPVPEVPQLTGVAPEQAIADIERYLHDLDVALRERDAQPIPDDPRQEWLIAGLAELVREVNRLGNIRGAGLVEVRQSVGGVSIGVAPPDEEAPPYVPEAYIAIQESEWSIGYTGATSGTWYDMTLADLGYVGGIPALEAGKITMLWLNYEEDGSNTATSVSMRVYNKTTTTAGPVITGLSGYGKAWSSSASVTVSNGDELVLQIKQDDGSDKDIWFHAKTWTENNRTYLVS